MPKIPAKPRPSERLEVRRHAWATNGQPRTEVLVRGAWEPCPSLDDARTLAARLGLSGIHITPC